MFTSKNNSECLTLGLAVSLLQFVMFVGVCSISIAARPVEEASAMSFVAFEGLK